MDASPNPLAQKLGRFWAHLIKRRDIPAAILVDDPIAGALRDIDILLAFAAQSYKKIGAEKVEALINAAAAVSNAKAAGLPIPPAAKSALWIAYDDLAVDMAPLSAHSIRSSMQVNCLRFPFNLFTPTAHNAALTVAVFFIGLSLQGFWVAGKELVDRADAIEIQKRAIQQKMIDNAGLVQRNKARQDDLDHEICVATACKAEPSHAPQTTSAPDAARLATLRAEIRVARLDQAEKLMRDRELNDELEKVNDNSRPLEHLLVKWHSRAQGVCDSSVLRLLCPVEIHDRGAEAGGPEHTDVVPAKYAPASAADGRTERAAASAEESIRHDQQRLKADADRFRSIAAEVRIIVANIGTYLIAMIMGVLGALTFILRTLSHQLREHTYVPVSASISIVRVCLGAIAGVFGSLLAPGADTALKSLPPLFIPFVFGYGIEILFSLLDKVVRTFTQAETAAARKA
ncbi:MAG: hypothetical protein V4857_18370 [Pseudomonadota bacterium]